MNMINCIQWNSSCEATPFASEKWPFKRGGLSSGVKINTFMLTFTLSNGHSRGVASRQGGLSKGVPPSMYWYPFCEATPFASEKWPFKRGGLSSGVKINTFMLTFTLSSGHSRGAGLSSGWPLKRGSTVYAYFLISIYVIYF